MRIFRYLLLFLAFSKLVFAANTDFVENFVNKLSNKKGYVISNEGNGTILTDLGKDKNVFKGMRIKISKKEESIVHPITGEVIAEKTSDAGLAVIDDVYDKFSTAKILSGDNISAGDYAEIILPVRVNLEFYNTDSYTEDEIKSLLIKSGKFSVDKKSPHSMKFYEDSSGGLIFEVDYYNDVIGKFYSTDLKVETSDNEREIYQQEFEAKGYIQMAVCNLKGDGYDYAVMAEDRNVDIYKIVGNKFQFQETIDRKFDNIITVSCYDLNDNKIDEIFISISNKGRGARSFIYEYNEGNLGNLKDSIPLALRDVYLNGKKNIVAQRLTRDGRFVGNINFLIYNGDYIKGEAIANTQGFSIYGFGLGDVDLDGKMDLIYSNEKNLLEIYNSDGDIIYKSRETYADSVNYFLMKERKTDKLANKEEVDKLLEITSRIYMKDRIFVDKRGAIITTKSIFNDNVVPTFEKYFNKVVTVNLFENSMLKNIWTSKDFGTDVNDFYYVKNGKKSVIYVLKGEKGNFFTKSRSSIVTIVFPEGI
jgi:hypothetical protein